MEWSGVEGSEWCGAMRCGMEESSARRGVEILFALRRYGCWVKCAGCRVLGDGCWMMTGT
jgi:hypothetical protein